VNGIFHDALVCGVCLAVMAAFFVFIEEVFR
jgi:hypothetical protein